MQKIGSKFKNCVQSKHQGCSSVTGCYSMTRKLIAFYVPQIKKYMQYSSIVKEKNLNEMVYALCIFIFISTGYLLIEFALQIYKLNFCTINKHLFISLKIYCLNKGITTTEFFACLITSHLPNLYS